MKKFKIYVSLIIGLVFVACTDDELRGINLPEEEVSNVRTVNDVIEIVYDAYSSLYGESVSRSGLNITVDNVKVFGSGKISRSTADDASMYVVNFGDNQGFAVVTANKNCTPLLAFAESGQVNEIDSIDNPGLKAFMENALAYSSLKPIGGDGREPITPMPTPPTIVEIVDTVKAAIEPKVKTNFGQRWPEGYFCPNKISGCVITAAVQAMSYYEYPKSISLTYPSKDQSEQLLPWVYYKEYLQSKSYYPSTIYMDTISLHHYYGMARFCRELGYRVKADYSKPDATGARIADMQPLLSRLVPQVKFSDIVYEVPTESNIKGNDIIMMTGFSRIDEDGRYVDGHTWLIDGYKSETHHYRVYEVNYPVVEGIPFVPQGYPKSEYDKKQYALSHINWGWNGTSNGYYDIGVFDLTKCIEYDDENNVTFDASDYKYYVHYFTMNKE